MKKTSFALLSLSILSAGMLLAVSLATAPRARASETSAPRLVRDDVPRIFTPERWATGSGGDSGRFGDDAGFWYVDTPNYHAVWEFEQTLQGMYRPAYYIPGRVGFGFDADPMPSGVARYLIQEKNSDGSWTTVESFLVDQGALADDSSSWWFKTRMRDGIPLNGEIRVLVRLPSGRSGIVVADSFRFRWQGPLPIIEDTDTTPEPTDLPRLEEIRQIGDNFVENNTLSPFYQNCMTST